MGSKIDKKSARIKKQMRLRKKIKGTPDKPRLCVFRSLKHIYVQLIDDVSGCTIAAASSIEKASIANKNPGSKKEIAGIVGEIVAQRAIEKGIKTIVFDRNGFIYHGRVKAVSEGARKAGLAF